MVEVISLLTDYKYPLEEERAVIPVFMTQRHDVAATAQQNTDVDLFMWFELLINFTILLSIKYFIFA